MLKPSIPSTPPRPKTQKPPLGVMPRRIHDEKRRQELGGAIARYIEAGLPVNLEWVKEYNELLEREQATTPNNMRVHLDIGPGFPVGMMPHGGVGGELTP